MKEKEQQSVQISTLIEEEKLKDLKDSGISPQLKPSKITSKTMREVRAKARAARRIANREKNVINVEDFLWIKDQVDVLKKELNEFKKNSYKDKFLLQHGAHLNQLEQEYPVRVYLRDGDVIKTTEVEFAMQLFIYQLDSYFVADYEAIYSSWYKEWFARTFNKKSNEDLQRDLFKARKALEIKALGHPISEIDKNYSESAAMLLNSVKDQNTVVMQIGALLLVKFKNSGGEFQTVIKVLTIEQLILLEENPKLLSDPCTLIEKLQNNAEIGTDKIVHMK